MYVCIVNKPSVNDAVAVTIAGGAASKVNDPDCPMVAKPTNNITHKHYSTAH